MSIAVLRSGMMRCSAITIWLFESITIGNGIVSTAARHDTVYEERVNGTQERLEDGGFVFEANRIRGIEVAVGKLGCNERD